MMWHRYGLQDQFLEFQETDVYFSLDTTSLKVENCLRQIKPVVAVCMEIIYHFIHRRQE